MIRHPQFDGNSMHGYDIAILILGEEQKGDSVKYREAYPHKCVPDTEQYFASPSELPKRIWGKLKLEITGYPRNDKNSQHTHKGPLVSVEKVKVKGKHNGGIIIRYHVDVDEG